MKMGDVAVVFLENLGFGFVFSYGIVRIRTVNILSESKIVRNSNMCTQKRYIDLKNSLCLIGHIFVHIIKSSFIQILLVFFSIA